MADDIVARYTLKFNDLASPGLMRVAGVARKATAALAIGAAALGAAAIAVGGAVLKSADHYANFVDELDESATKMNVNLNYLRDLRSSMGELGVEAGQVDAGLTKFNINLGELSLGAGSFGKKLGEVAPALKKQLEGVKDGTEANKIALGYLGRITDAQERAKVAAMLYGKAAGPAFAGALSDVVALNEAFAKSRGISGVLSEEDVKQAGAYTDSISRLKTGFNAMSMAVGGAAVPGLTKLSDGMLKFMIANRGAIKAGADKLMARLGESLQKIDFEKVGNSLLVFIDNLPMLVGMLAKVLEYLPEIAIAFAAFQGVSFIGGMVRGFGGLANAAKLASGPVASLVGSKGFGALVKGGTKLGPMLLRGAAMLGPWGMAAAAAGAGAWALYENWDTVGPLLGDMAKQAGDKIMEFADTDWFAKGQQIGTMIENWFGSIDWAGISTWVTTFFGKIGDQLDKIDFAQLGGDIGAKISKWFSEIDWAAVGSTIWTVLSTIGKIMGSILLLIGGVAWKLLTTVIGAAWNKVKAMGIAAWEGVKASAISAWDSIKNSVLNNIDSIIAKMNGLIALWNNYAPSFMAVGKIQPLQAGVNSAGTGAANARSGNLNMAFNHRFTGLPNGAAVQTQRARGVTLSGNNRPYSYGR